MASLATRILSFQELTNAELYSILQLRASIFVVEQNCVYQDMDGTDKNCLHLLGYYGEQIMAYSRIIPPNDQSKEVHIGRVLVSKAFRGLQLGREIMQHSIEKANVLFPGSEIQIAAQCYLKEFYESLGFTAFGEEYLWDGIPHLDMQWRKAM